MVIAATAALLAGGLAFAASGDRSLHRIVGTAGCAGLASLLLQMSFVTWALLAAAGLLRLPDDRRSRMASLAFALVVTFTVQGSLWMAQNLMEPSQFRCG